jgi:hypothetical protein
MSRKARLILATGLAVVFFAIFAVTLFWPDWIELVFGADPDEGNGAVEWAIVAVSGALALVSILIARTEWRRQQLLKNEPTRI